MTDRVVKLADDDNKTVVEVCLSRPLYRVLATGKAATELAEKIQYTSLTFDTYCVGCKRDATFKRPAKPKPVIRTPPGAPAAVHHISRWQTVNAECTRNGHTYTFMFAPYGDGISKVGQVPSGYDIASADLRRFAGVLDDLDVKELQQAVMLHTHGAAIGAFVYLRRIFERLLGRHREQYEAQHGQLEDFADLSVEDQVLALKDVLPEEVVENRKVYKVLSKGIHNLQEEECAALYDVMHAALIEILERDIYNKQRAKSSAELRRAVADAAGAVKMGGEKGTTDSEAAERA